MKKTVAILTSGGDSPGMNAAIRAAVRAGLASDMRVVGVKRGYNGLINGDVLEMDLRSVSDIIQRGGTILYTARSPEFLTEEGFNKAILFCNKEKIDGVIVIGGDGSFRGASKMTSAGVPCIGIPGTIDNDIACSEYTIGFDTAMNTAVGMIDKLRDTAQSHDRCSVVEVMGRNCGDIALYTGIAVGATAILVPEVLYDFEKDIIERMKFTQLNGKKHFIIIVAEGVGHVQDIARKIQDRTGIDSRATVLGHVQRGGSPTLRDRVVASEMSAYAIEIFLKGKSNRVVAMKDGKILDYDIAEALIMKKSFSENLYKTAFKISI
ncbi:MAG: 6-phosphofructokinase [Oscillospiraceae bacterium]|jgi:6-phosphofructokinase 1|nr:6-phosphofructokinase [Oscillospiraceae bacterium]